MASSASLYEVCGAGSTEAEGFRPVARMVELILQGSVPSLTDPLPPEGDAYMCTNIVYEGVGGQGRGVLHCTGLMRWLPVATLPPAVPNAYIRGEEVYDLAAAESTRAWITEMYARGGGLATSVQAVRKLIRDPDTGGRSVVTAERVQQYLPGRARQDQSLNPRVKTTFNASYARSLAGVDPQVTQRVTITHDGAVESTLNATKGGMVYWPFPGREKVAAALAGQIGPAIAGVLQEMCQPQLPLDRHLLAEEWLRLLALGRNLAEPDLLRVCD